MPGNADKRIYDAIDRHFAGGLPMTKQTLLRKNAQKRVALCWQVFQMWKENPMMDVMSCLLYTFHRTAAEAYNDKKVFDYICQKHIDTSRQSAFLKSSRAKELIIERSMARGDDKLALDAIRDYDAIHHLKENVPEERNDVMVAALPLVVTGDVRHIDKERENVDKKQLAALYRKYDGKPDELMAKYEEKKSQLRKDLNIEEEATMVVDNDDGDDYDDDNDYGDNNDYDDNNDNDDGEDELKIEN